MTEKCNCEYCLRNEQYSKKIKSISDYETRVWFEEMYDKLNAVEEDLSAYKIYISNLKNLYPKIWKEVTTVKILSKDEAKFPEIQLK